MKKTPKLRFKEFSGDWEVKKLGELGEFKNGVNKPKEDFGYGNPFVNLMDVFGKNSIQCEEFELVNVTYKELKESNLLEGDVLFIRSSVKPSGVGLTAVVLEDLKDTVYSGFLIRFRDNNYLNLNFKKYCFYNSKFRNELMSKSSTSANTNINQESLKLLDISIPEVKEQEKISTFLSLIDDKIYLQGEKVEALKDYKKGMMQKIFSRELRFKDDEGCDYPEWEEKKLGAVSDVRDGTHDSPKYIENGFRFITSKNLSNNGKIDFNNINYISEEDYININKRSKVDIGDILFGMIGTIGNPVIVEEDGFAIKNVALIKQKEILLNKYLIQVLNSSIVNKQFHVLNAGGTQKFIALGVIRDLIIPIPTHEEQLKIIKVLNNIDLKIEKEQEKLDSLNEYKKGLLQHMFV